MNKLNNKGITLIELLVSLCILSIFMVTVNYFIASTSRSTQITKRQVSSQRDANDVLELLFDNIAQATAVDIAVTGVSGDAEEASGDARVKPLNASDMSPSAPAHLISPEACKTIEYVKNGDVSFATSDDYKDKNTSITIGESTGYKKNDLGAWHQEKPYVSRAQYEAAMMFLNGDISTYGVFDDREYDVSGIYLGPVPLKSGNVYNTIVYETKDSIVAAGDSKRAKDGGYLYLNRNETGADFSINKDSLIATNCTGFKITTNGKNSNSLIIKLEFNNEGFVYTTGGTVNLRNAKVMK